MPKYYEYKIAGYYLYFTSHCIIECMHVMLVTTNLQKLDLPNFL